MDLTREALVTETRTMFAAAIDSPVIVITFVFKVLSILPDVQDRVHAELSDVLQGSDRPVTSEDMSKFAYMERVIKETMRLFPVAPLVARRVSEDMELAGKDIPAGTTLVLNLISTHRDPRHWPDPLGFDPDRFLPERAAAMHPYSYLPFSAGPRNCIGQVYAMMLLKTMLATMLRAYRVLPACDGITEPSQLPLTFDIMLRCVGGIRVRFEPRAAAA
ncbi:hypothetical protein ONE63_005133 [Megalurothrips usitatus]|uniref:Cytochrome P450 4C1-like n=1 Tax=Megalurothrips usitatus TaxID=439358 RepID=A0AAV7XXN0_9NEOP|nr:hypothetical protein ONE63_005133 [Megalurothrips usitatus]